MLSLLGMFGGGVSNNGTCSWKNSERSPRFYFVWRAVAKGTYSNFNQLFSEVHFSSLTHQGEWLFRERWSKIYFTIYSTEMYVLDVPIW